MLRISVFLLLLNYIYAQKSAGVYLFDPTGTSTVTGTIVFKESDGVIAISGTVRGLTAGKHGFHIHQLGNIAGGCKATGPHFNPHNLTHGAPDDKIRHVGDLGNIVAGNDGNAVISISDSVIALSGDHSIIGRAVVVHAGTDDLGKGGNAESLNTGNAGDRVACGVIGILNSASTRTASLSILILTVLATLKICLNKMWSQCNSKKRDKATIKTKFMNYVLYFVYIVIKYKIGNIIYVYVQLLNVYFRYIFSV